MPPEQLPQTDKPLLGFTCSSFDLLHAGHILMLAEAHQYCGELLVGLHVDPSIEMRKERKTKKNRPIQSASERMIQLEACKYIDDIIVYETEADLINILKGFPINIRFLGEEYKEYPTFTGKDVCEELGIEIIYTRRQHGYSTTELRKRVYEAYT